MTVFLSFFVLFSKKVHNLRLQLFSFLLAKVLQILGKVRSSAYIKSVQTTADEDIMEGRNKTKGR